MHSHSEVQAINNELHHLFMSGHVCENRLSKYKARVENCLSSFEPAYWLLLARINEAALLTAADYADNAEFTAVGDLLVNPGKINVHLRGKSQPVVKKRHGRLSDQFNTGQCKRDFMKWFSRNAVVEQAQPPLLPDLIEKLYSSGFVPNAYIDACHVRLRQITDTMNFLISWGIWDFEGLANKRANSDPSTLQFIEDHMCRFDIGWFIQLGMDIAGFYLQKQSSGLQKGAVAGLKT